MNFKRKSTFDNNSTPKRGPGKSKRVLLTPQARSKKVKVLNSTPRNIKFSPANTSASERCESPLLPCNQIEYLCDSGSNSSICSEIPCSPGILESCLGDVGNWESFVASKENKGQTQSKIQQECVEEIDEVYDELFHSKLEQESLENNQNVLVKSNGEEFKEKVEESFNMINQSISNINNDNNLSSLFETKDSFLLDIRESGIILDQTQSNQNKSIKSCSSRGNSSSNSFYGLPVTVKGLFKTYRNIEKFYEWQEECLNLNDVKERRNLIYALPTSGGKTLVAEVLMLREVLNRKHNALFILPFVAIVQEKIWALSPFALQLDFLLEEYAAGKGHLPPKKRRKKNSIYIATIEKGLALVRSLIEENRLHELGLIVVDELHLIGEPGRGGTLEMLLTTVIFANKGIQIVGMSATLGNLPELARFLRAAVFERHFRPVELVEYVKLGAVLHRLVWADRLEVVPERELAFDYSAAGSSLDPDRLGGLVAEVAPAGGVLLFCPTKRNCENVAALLSRLQRREMLVHRAAERAALQAGLRAEGGGPELLRYVRCGVAYHHAGLSGDERVLLEQAFRSGVISVLCCTSTLAAGVNLPARRVIIRAPRVGREPLSLAAYKQMVGRAGRAGVSDTGESIIVCSAREWPELRRALQGGLPAARSALGGALPALLLSAVALQMAATRAALRALVDCTLLAVAPPDTSLDLKEICDDALRELLKGGALEIVGRVPLPQGEGACVIHNDTQFAVSALGRAAIKGCMELALARRLLQELRLAARGLVLLGSLHLLFLVAPDDTSVTLDYAHYYSVYSALDEEGLQTARALGISESNAVRMLTGRPLTNVSESVLRRFYLALVLRELWRQAPVAAVAARYGLGRGTVQALMLSASSFAAGAHRLCEHLESPRPAQAQEPPAPALWSFTALFDQLAARLRHCAAPDLHELMELPAVRKARALQLVRAGFRRVQDVARATPQQLADAVAHLSLAQAQHLASAARMSLIEKVENLRAEAEDVMDDLRL